MASKQQVTLQRMPQQPGLIGTEDDWTGVTSSAARRKVQNRINQRARRKRKRKEAQLSQTKQPISSELTLKPLPQLPQGNGIVPRMCPSRSSAGEARSEERDSLEQALWRLYSAAADRSHLNPHMLARVARVCKLDFREQQRYISVFGRRAEQYQIFASPRTDHVLVLIKFNVLRALLSNGMDLGYTGREGVYGKAVLSPFSDPSNQLWHRLSIPEALQPTRLQRQIPHHPWIDLLPCPQMRDNLLRAGDTYDVMALCADLVGSFSADKGRTGMIVWGEPWDIAGWEVTESLVKHWGWTIRGCEQLLRSTNFWRKRRGDRLLQFERLDCEGDQGMEWS